MSKSRIKVVLEGPYLVTGGVPIKKIGMDDDGNGGTKDWKDGKAYDAQDTYALCRCGHSEGKPFCDGTHTKLGWVGKETASRELYEDAARVYEGDAIDMLDERSLCAVARFCDVAQGAWKLTLMSNDKTPEYEELATYQASSCPSGRLTIRKDGVLVEPELPQEIGVVEDLKYKTKGPLYVQGGITIEDTDGCEFEVRNRVTLCRCGESRNLPYCDASHLKCPHMRGLSDE
ncbi:MAG: CDGSH iron-sulfur domain-containing protein [Clostridiales Family XIII bacterium]|nr:CDGSH iron-sulfur domain-containing protein [Clostridiales Family XIII bacterium]